MNVFDALRKWIFTECKRRTDGTLTFIVFAAEPTTNSTTEMKDNMNQILETEQLPEADGEPLKIKERLIAGLRPFE